MPGNYQRHLDNFGFCKCGNPSGDTEMLGLEVQNERTGRWSVKRVPSCADCFGIKM